MIEILVHILVTIFSFIAGFVLSQKYFKDKEPKVNELSFLGKKESLKKGRVVFHDDEELYIKELEKGMERK